MKKTALTLAALLWLYSGSLHAQEQATPQEWSLTTGSVASPPKWMKQFTTGILVVANDLGGLTGIDPEQHKAVWTKPELKGVKEEDIQDINGSPLAMINYPVLGSPFGRVIIINTVDGTEIFDSKDEHIRMGDYYPLASINSLLLEGTKEKRAFQMLIDFNTNERKWTVDRGEGKSGWGALMGKMKGAMRASMGSQKFPFVDAEGNIVLVEHKNISRIDIKTGAFLWTSEYDKKIGRVKETEGKIYFGEQGKSNLHCIALATGQEEWKKPVKLDGNFNNLVSYSDHEMIVLHSDGFNILDLSTLAFKWKRDPSVGDVSEIRILDNGFVTAHMEEKKAMIAYTNMEGKKVWDKDLDDALITYNVTPKGVYYVTTDRANVLTMEEGRKVWRKDIKIKGIPRYLVDAQSNAVIMYTNKNLYKFDMGAGEYKTILEDIELKDYVDKDADRNFGVGLYSIDFNDHNDMLEIENVGGKYLVRSNQNMWLIEESGNVVYKKYYKDAAMSKGVRSLLRAASAGGGFFTSYSAMAGVGSMPGDIMSGNTSKTERHLTNAQVSAVSSDGLRALSARVAATKSSRNAVSILTRFDDGTKGLVSVDKVTGEEKARILFKDNTPIYVVDDVMNKLYLVVGTEVSCYDLEKKAS
ncbi:Outer membrane protein assembly factor BamB, contains PQQ-like beta-propeller repeat [Filimonas lacunae]|uniref:Outer membrane protein assembly factor BamB, contains PQQ-like beta-propeller repeat n=1 Tax=Filimonas lacunae TaxID=477680 RepID=A0A173MKI1_9BACT|nr:PQQ-binding-like beta-propeller repeat protein [Filimonas lacunae]BAV07986.1 hypothetical protein FLA_4019 [Filimonas lacunae]SIT07497.1 Outer membrane protein assembly factor BamB, contains PQQ-like beta-propeller repeat [Filimonas lacunae]